MLKKILIFLLPIFLLALLGYYFFFSPALAGLRVVSQPKASVFLEEKLLGETPLEVKYKPGEYILKLVPTQSSNAFVWQGKIVLRPALETYVKRNLGLSELTSSGEILSLEKISDQKARLEVISSPEAAKVALDGEEKGITPLSLTEVNEGEHDLTVSSPGFLSQTERIQTIAGYRLTVNFQLALAETSPSAEIAPTGFLSEEKKTPPEESKKTYILIQDTPTGFLRVRSEPSTSSEELTKVKPGEKYPLLEEKSGWFKISYEEGKEGWVSGRYAKKVE